MIKVNNEEYTSVIYQGENWDKVFYGTDLVFEKNEDVNDYDPTILYIKGKFTNNSSSSGQFYYANGSFSASNKINISQYVNPETKNFEVQIGKVGEITDLTFLFYINSSLEEISIFPVDENITKMNSTFYNCTNLKTINAINWDLQNVTSFSMMFMYCSNLENINGTINNIKNNLSLSESTKLSQSSVMVLINGLSQVDSSKKITFSKASYNTLTDEQKQIAIDKGWTIASA